MKKAFFVIIFVIIIFAFCSSCVAGNLENFEGIYHSKPFGYDIQLKRNDIIYSAYVTAAGVLLSDGSKTALDIPQGKQIGVFKGNKDLKNEKFKIYEVEGYDPDEWIYMFFGNNGERGIALYKTNNVIEIPEQFMKLKVVEISKTYILSRESQQVIDNITNFDSPIIEVIEDYGSENKVVWKVTYTTTLDAFLGPISMYIDGYTEGVVGVDLIC